MGVPFSLDVKNLFPAAKELELAGVKATRTGPVRAWRIRIPEKMNRRVRRGTDAMNGRVGDDTERRTDQRDADGDVHTFARAVGERDRRLRDGCADGVVGGDDVVSAAAKGRIVVREHTGNMTEPQSIERLEREVLQTVPEREPATADRLGPVRQNGTEALRGSHERARRIVECVGEARGRRVFRV